MSARRLASLAGLAAAALAVPAFAAPATSAAPAPEKAATTVASYTGSATAQAASKAFFDTVMRTAVAKQRKTGIAAVTVVYDPSGAPSFANEISQSTQIWNSSVGNVQLVAGSNADFDYREGNDPRGSHAYTDGHGHGYVFIDYAQAQQYDPLRIVAHETGHILGLPDHYEGPCSELMSGGGPGPSCTNAQPDANERARVEQLWANGKTSLGTFATVR